jgi:hypothetical protein
MSPMLAVTVFSLDVDLGISIRITTRGASVATAARSMPRGGWFLGA